MEPVTSVLLERRREPAGLRKMLGVSLALHVLAGVALVASPLLFPQHEDDQVRTVMTINLGAGAPGPMIGGANPIAGRPVQTTEPAPKPEAIRPPAARQPEMTMPAPKTKPAPKPEAKSELEEGSGRTPARGTELRPGTAFGETGAQGSGFGLSTGGLGGGGSYLEGVSDFCCPEYLTTMISLIQSNWNAQMGAGGEVMVRFTVRRDGTIVDVQVERRTNNFALDSGAERAVRRTAKLPPLPPAFTGNQLTVHLLFQYRQ